MVGLGNPGRGYVRTLHNVGFEVVDGLAERLGAPWRALARFGCELAEAAADCGRILLLKPGLFMNRSGEAVAPVMRYRGLATVDLLVVADDMALPVGRLRLRASGSPGGHRGLESIAQALGTDAFARLRIGVGAPASAADWAEHVLRAPPPDERRKLQDMIRHGTEAVLHTCSFGVEDAMNRFNGFRLEETDA